MTSEFEKTRRSLLKSGQLFEDPDFPCIQSSVFYHETPPFNFTWKRPHEVCKDPKFLSVGADSTDSKQSPGQHHANFESILGKLGDPWFVSSISTLYLTKGLFYRVVPADQSFDELEYAGIFRFRIWWFGQWQEVMIDDRLPIVSHSKLAFVQAINGNVFWPALLEKAFAKLHGSYEALKYGTSLESLSDLTGGVTELMDLKSDPMNMLNTRILMQRLLSITSIVTAVISIDDASSSSLLVDSGNSLAGRDVCSRVRQQRQEHQKQQQHHFMFGDHAHEKNGSSYLNAGRKNQQAGYQSHAHYHHHGDGQKSSSSLSSSSSDHSPLQSLVNSHLNPSFSSSSQSSLPAAAAGDPFPRLPCGLIANINYRISVIERVETVIGENREQVFLLKLVNSMGSKCDYTGPFGHKNDAAWDNISDCDRVRIDAMDEEEDDGDFAFYDDFYNKSSSKRSNSFWIEYTDFMRMFTHLEVVYLDAETSRDEPSLRSGSRFPMTVKLYRGSWRKGVTAGGCRNNTDSFHQNPQIELTLSLESDDMTIICLNQHSVLEPQVVGFSIYNAGTGVKPNPPSLSSSSSSSSSSSPLSIPAHASDKKAPQPQTKQPVQQQKMDRSFFKRNKSLINSSYSNSRQVLLRCSLDRGSYILMPTSFEPGNEGSFTIRVYSMKGIKLRLLDHENSMSKSAILKSPASFDNKFSEYEIIFMQIADEHKSVNAHDLQELLDSSLPNDYVKSCATIDVARLIISALDHGHSAGRLHFKEYKNIMCSLRFWQNTFKNHTKGTTGILRVERLEDALHEIGFRLSSDVMSALVLKFMRKDSTLRFGDFVAVILHLTISFNSFAKFQQKQDHQRKIVMKQTGMKMQQQPFSHLSDQQHSLSDPSICSSNTVSLTLTEWLKISFST